MPYLGICLGMQIAVIEFCPERAAAIEDANSGEFDPSTRLHPVIDLMPDQNGEHQQGRHPAPGRLPLR